MPPSLALAICVALCFVMLWRDRKARAEMDSVLWLPTLWFSRCASRNISAWTSGGLADPAGGIDMYFLLALIILGYVAVSRRWSAAAAAVSANKWMWLMYAYMLASVFWSDSPEDSFKRWVRTGGDVIMALLLTITPDPLAALKEVLRRSCMVLIPFSLVLSKYFPEYGRLQEKDWAPDTWIGVTTHKNPLGMLCLLSSFYFVAHILGKKAQEKWTWRQAATRMWSDFLTLAISIYLLFGIGANANSVSSTSKLTFILAVAMYLWLRRFRGQPERVGRNVLTVVGLLLALQMVMSVGFDSSIRALVAQSQNKDPGLSERTQLWDDVIKVANDHPILGSGYASFWTGREGAYLRSIYTWGPFQAHSGYIETYANLGWIGVLLLTAIILASLRGAFRMCLFDFEYGIWRLVLLTCCLVENYAEAGFPRPTHILWFTFLATALYNPAVESATAEDAEAEIAGEYIPRGRTSEAVPA